MDKNGNITLSYDTWKHGIQTPLTGMGDIVNIDIFDKPGVAKIALAPTALATSNFTDTPVVGAPEYGNDVVFLVDNDGKTYEYDLGSDALTAKNNGSVGVQGGVWWKGYLITTVLNGADIELDAYISNTWTSNWDTLTADSGTSASFNTIHSSPADNDLYIGYGRYVGRVSEATTFDPPDGGTFTTIEKFLTLPNGFIVRDITTFANFLIVSASPQGFSKDLSPFYGARLYYWDLSQSATAAVEFTGFVELNTNVASPVVARDNTVYYLKWADKTWGASNLSSTSTLFNIRNQSAVTVGGFLTSSDSCASITNNYFVVGLSSTGDSQPAGIYLIQDDVYTRNTLSTGEVGANDTIDIQYITTVGCGEYIVGYEDTQNTSYVVDYFGKSGYRYTSYGAYMESPLYGVSGSLKKRSYQQLEVSLAKELATGEGVKVSYRKNLSDSWTVIATFDFATYGALAQFNSVAKITDASTLQIKVEMTTGSSSTTTPELISVRLF